MAVPTDTRAWKRHWLREREIRMAFHKELVVKENVICDLREENEALRRYELV